MPRFPVDAPLARVLRALEDLGFRVARRGEYLPLVRENADGSRTPLTMPNHRTIKASTLRMICAQAGIARDDFIDAYERA